MSSTAAHTATASCPRRKIALCLSTLGAAMFFAMPSSANTTLDFETPLPAGLAAMSFGQGTPVPDSARVTDEYVSLGIVFSGAALIEMGVGHAASGANGLAGISSNGLLDYEYDVTFLFVAPGDSARSAATNYFAFSGDLGGRSGNTVTLTAYDFGGQAVGSASYVESDTFLSPLVLTGVGEFHSVTVHQTQNQRGIGGIGIDLVTFGDLRVTGLEPGSVPEPTTLALLSLSLGLAGIGFSRRKQ